MAKTPFEESIILLDSIGFTDVVLPFVFVFIVVYAILQKTKFLGAHKNYQIMIAFVFGFISVASIQLVDSILSFFWIAAMASIIGVSFQIVLGTLGIKSLGPTKGSWNTYIPMIIVVVSGISAIGYLVLKAFGIEENILDLLPNIPSGVFEMILIVFVFIAIIWYVVGSSSKTNIISRIANSKPKISSAASKPVTNQNSTQSQPRQITPEQFEQIKNRFPPELRDQITPQNLNNILSSMPPNQRDELLEQLDNPYSS